MSPEYPVSTKFGRRGQLTALLSVAALAVVSLFVYLTWAGYQAAIQAAETTTRNYAAIIEARLDATLRRADGNLQDLVHKIPIAALSRQAAPRYARELNADLDSRLVNFPELAGLRIFDANGDRLYTTASGTSPRTHISDRNYFRLLRDNPGAGLVFSEVIISRSRNQPSMVAARALRDGQGAFHGIVFVAIELGHFQKLFQSLDIGAQGTISWRRADDHRLVLRWPHLADAVNKPLNPQNPTVLRLAAGERMTTQHITAETDGIAHILSTHALERYPFYVNVAFGRDDVLAAWRARSLAVGLSGLLLLGLLAGMLYRLWRAEAALRERDAWFGAAFEQAAVGMALRDIDPRNPRLLRVNQKLCDILGYTREELQQMTSIDLTPPDDRHLASDYNERLMQGEITGYSREKRYVHKDGHLVWTDISLSAIHGDDGRPAHAMVVIQDITRHKQVEETQARLAAIVETSNDAIISRALDYKITSWNAAAERMFGYTAAEAIGQDAFILVPPDRKEENARNRALLAQGRAVLDLETVRLAKGGRRIEVSLSQSPIKNENGAMVGVSLIFRDISKRKEAEDRFHATFEQAAVGIAHIAVDSFRILMANRKFCDLLGYTQDELIGTDSRSRTPAGEMPERNAERAQLVAGAVKTSTCERQLIRKDGSLLWVSRILSLVRDAAGQPKYYISVIEDITERRRAEEIQARLAAIVETSNDAIISRSPDDKIMSWNAAAERLFGYTAAEALGQSIAMIFPPDRKEEIARNRALLAQGRAVLDLETERLAKGGRRIDVSLSQSPIRDASGAVVGVALIFRDIRERKLAQESQAQLAAIVENANDAIISRSLDGTIKSWNAAAERLFGYSAAEAIGPDFRMVPPDLRHEVTANRARLREGKTVSSYETARVTKDGRRIEVSRSMFPIKDPSGNTIGTAAIIRDITRRKQAEAQLRLAASVVDNAAEGILITDAENNIISVNPAFTEITGYAAAEVIGKNPRIFSSGKQDNAFYDEMWAAVKTAGRWQGEIWDKRKNGELYCELLSVAAVRDEKGQVIQHCGIFADITRRKIAESELMRLNAELEERVAARTQDLERTNRELEAFSYSVSHDLRAPLRVIHGFSQIVLKAEESRLDEVSVRHLGKITAGARRMAELIDDLLLLSRISRQAMRRQTVDLSELSAMAIKELTLAHPARNVDVVITPAMEVKGDPGLLHIALENLLGNAWKFTARTDGARIDIGRFERDGELIYFVRDNGAGFDMKYAPKLFGAFQRLHTPEEFEGTGIGLSIVQRIVARHDGRIWAEAKVGEGTTLYFTLEQSKRPAGARAP